MSAAANLVKNIGGEIVDIAFLIELAFLNGREKIKEYPTYAVIEF